MTRERVPQCGDTAHCLRIAEVLRSTDEALFHQQFMGGYARRRFSVRSDVHGCLGSGHAIGGGRPYYQRGNRRVQGGRESQEDSFPCKPGIPERLCYRDHQE